ncbi:hypothetical protein HMPREF9413_2199 [Paenibacillus sp. HGF7]|nr:hypothetical protein HMPREF9413_2199 [Paenibacillus sp. HGF7]
MVDKLEGTRPCASPDIHFLNKSGARKVVEKVRGIRRTPSYLTLISRRNPFRRLAPHIFL